MVLLTLGGWGQRPQISSAARMHQPGSSTQSASARALIVHNPGVSICPPGRSPARIPGRPARAPWPGPPAPGPTHGHRPRRRPPAGAPQAAHRGPGCAVANRYGAGNMQTGRACPPLVCARSRAAMPLRGVAPAPARCGPHCSAGPAGQRWVARDPQVVKAPRLRRCAAAAAQP